MRHNLSVKEIAFFEAAANNAYISCCNMLQSLTPGITEAEVARSAGYDGTLGLATLIRRCCQYQIFKAQFFLRCLTLQ